MNPKLIVFFAMVAAACAEEFLTAPAPVPDRYPAGVDPLLCPDYPNCDNALLHSSRVVVFPTYVPADGFPPGVDPVKCPNYPYCGTPAKAIIVPRYADVDPITGEIRNINDISRTPISVPEFISRYYIVRRV